MLTPDYLLHISEGAEEIAAQLHTDIIKRISDRVMARLKRGDAYILTSIDKYQIETLFDAGYLREEIIREISKATGFQAQEIAEAFEDAGVRAWNYDSKIYEGAGLPVTDLRQSPHMIRLLQRNYEATMGEWENYTRTTADVAQQAFIATMDRAYNNITSGNLGYIQAYTEAIDALAKDGIYKIVYPSGHVDTIETAAMRCVRTGVSQASAQIQTARMDEYDVDLVLVSSHMGARPSHQVWQGKIYSRSGKSRKYPDFVSSTGYGTGAGLCGWNCRHNFSPYFEGMGNPFERYNDEKNKKLYEDTQNQRSHERQIRKTKRECDVLRDQFDSAPDDVKPEIGEMYETARRKLKGQMAEYRKFCADHDLRPLPERLKIAKAERAARFKKIPDQPQPMIARFDTYANKLKATLPAADQKAFGALVDNNENKAVRSLWERFADKCKDIRRIVNGGAYTPALDIVKYDFENHVGMSKYSTMAHEMSHMFDNHLGRVSGLSYNEVEAVNKKCVFGTLGRKTLPEVASNSDMFLEALRKDKVIMRELVGDSSTWQAVRANNSSSGVQDAIDGFFGKDAHTRWGHGDKYYNRFWNNWIKGFGNDKDLLQVYKDMGIAKNLTQAKKQARIYETASEAWANVGSALTVGGGELDMVKKYMPNTVEAFLKIAGLNT